jgi:hypothetical protein
MTEHKILTKPLPDILDELEDWISKVEEATKKAEAATLEAKQAAGEAKLAGEKAAGEAARVAGEKMAAIESSLSKRIDDLAATIEQVLQFAKRINEAQVAGLNANIKAYNEAIGQ